ncbi:MAG: pyridoxal-phosphate dependent enzyme, partial [Pseudomonadota bacterium]
MPSAADARPRRDQHALFERAVENIGRTPMIEVETPAGHGRIFAKCEWANPSGAVKDRVAMAMMRALVDEGLDPETDVVLEYSGGRLAMALAVICQKLGVRLVLVLGDFTPQEDLDRLHAAGAEIRLSPKENGFWGVMQTAFKLASENPTWRFLYQHANDANLRVHEETTAKEVIEQLPVNRLDAWVAAIGTGGTLIGAG